METQQQRALPGSGRLMGALAVVALAGAVALVATLAALAGSGRVQVILAGERVPARDVVRPLPAVERQGNGVAAVPVQDLPTSLEGDPDAIIEGARIFDVHCWACHGNGGGGAICPSFQDDETLHGDRYEDMLNVVTNGVDGKPMNAWKNKLTPLQLLQVAAYVYSLKGTGKPRERTTPYTLM